MTHELKKIFENVLLNQQNSIKSVLATVVFLEGSSYRKPGVTMLISEDGKLTGAVSGGCVEKEIKYRAESVFKTGEAKVMTYDGRYRLGCEGILYILIEPFKISEALNLKFQEVLHKRESFQISSLFKKEDDVIGNFGSQIKFNDNSAYKFNDQFDLEKTDNLELFTQNLEPAFKLIIIGGEHDSVKLCTMASFLGWDVEIITSIKDPKELSDFPGAKNVSAQTPEIADFHLDAQTAVILMTHNYALDLKYLLKLQLFDLKYIGILGSKKRRELILNELIELNPDLDEEFLDKIHSPAGLNIGAVTPEEIALSILSEILVVTRKTDLMEMQNNIGKIHSDQ
ncbi:XdhC family protein [Halpernia frigidisoli]|uniref:Xanthine and CO dehydrogenase maturation factor, XdhC/CoxF family n=1 Tax=Halpernia frigidisoli TaxID=1125876 RepID=A0A1I3D4R0_9FLAO|nr:XdhC/CoxI family protein [Halpernia frigidisoli]SFH81666.1 Xanthine and CO dehydrogenase maturation factor, XdhC/CoxF family [Halpernia frigidisoli]